jgi:hypothetical protein
MTTRKVLFSLIGSGIACLLLAGVGRATVAQAFVSTPASGTNSQAVPLVGPGSDAGRAWRTERHARLGRLQHWIDDHPVRSRILKIAATLAVLVAIQLLVQPSHAVIDAESASVQLRPGRHHHRSDGPA